jgi:hypothetical protein
VFCKNRDRLLNGDIARKFMISVLNLPEVRQLLSSEHFSGEGPQDLLAVVAANGDTAAASRLTSVSGTLTLW